MKISKGPVTATGIYQISDAAYHADPCPGPSLNNSIAKIVLRSPAHAHAAHPRLGGMGSVRTADMLTGSALHILLFGGDALITVIDADSFRTKAAQEERDASIAAGNIPLLAANAREAEDMANAAAPFVAELIPESERLAEITLVSLSDGVWKRGKADAADAALTRILDYKSAKSVSDSDLPFAIEKYGYHMQAAFYRALAAEITGNEPPEFTFLMQEKAPPYCVRVVTLDAAYQEIGENWVRRAVRAWATASARGEWPGYVVNAIVSPTSRAMQGDMAAAFSEEGEE